MQRGYATTNTDMGTTTTGLDFTFGVGHREMVVDWGYRSTHLMTQAAKQSRKAGVIRSANLLRLKIALFGPLQFVLRHAVAQQAFELLARRFRRVKPVG